MTGLTTFWLMVAIIQPADSGGPAIGAPAPAFSNRGADGRTYSLEVLKGKWVVLDRPQPDTSVSSGGRNFVSDALTQAMAGRSVETPVTTPYGCAVNYEP